MSMMAQLPLRKLPGCGYSTCAKIKAELGYAPELFHFSKMYIVRIPSDLSPLIWLRWFYVKVFTQQQQMIDDKLNHQAHLQPHPSAFDDQAGSEGSICFVLRPFKLMTSFYFVTFEKIAGVRVG